MLKMSRAVYKVIHYCRMYAVYTMGNIVYDEID